MSTPGITAGGIVALVATAVVGVVLAVALAAVEGALTRISRAVADEWLRQGRRGAGALADVVADPSGGVGLLALLRVLAEVAAIAAVAALLLGALVRPAAVALCVAGMGALLFALVTVAGRTLGRSRAESLALRSAGTVRWLRRVLGAPTRLLVAVGRALVPGRGGDQVFTNEAELRDIVEQAQQRGLIEQDERELLSGVFSIGDTLVREVMVPRPDILFVERSKTVRQALTLALRSGFSRLPVVGENIDDIIGVAYLKDLARRSQDDRDGDPVDTAMRQPAYVPDSKLIADLLKEMQSGRQHLAVVIDEYGGTAGLVTIEDILEEIVGEISDEYDREIRPYELLADGSARVTARLLIADFEDNYGDDARLAEAYPDVDTIGGLMAAVLGRVPIPGAVAEVGGLVFTAETAKGRRNRINTVLVRPADVADEAPPSGRATRERETSAGRR